MNHPEAVFQGAALCAPKGLHFVRRSSLEHSRSGRMGKSTTFLSAFVKKKSRSRASNSIMKTPLVSVIYTQGMPKHSIDWSHPQDVWTFSTSGAMSSCHSCTSLLPHELKQLALGNTQGSMQKSYDPELGLESVIER